MQHYLIQMIVFQLLFLLVYEVFLKKETFFTYNRIYLLVTPVLAMLLPLLKIPVLQFAIPAETLVMLPEVLIGGSNEVQTGLASNSVAPEDVQHIHWWLLAYGAGFLFSLGILFHKFRILKQLFSHRSVLKDGEMKIIEVPQSTVACTFYNTIFLGTDLSEKERKQILTHERVHVRQRHTLDLLYFELLKLIFWFNPLIYIYQTRISTIHEFLADAGVVKNVEKRTYFEQLLNSAFNTKDVSFINQFFNHSIIKKRIVMLQRSKSKTTSKFKFLIILPLMLAMLTYVACSSSKSGSGQVATQEAPPPPQPPNAVQPEGATEPLPEIDPNGPIPFAVVEQVPVFPGCEALTTNKEQKDCMSKKITEFVNRNFNTGLGKELGITGINRIYVQFKVAKNGEVASVRSRAPHPDLGAEAERVVNLLPDMEPAVHGGKEVAILYSLPIMFNVPEPEPAEEEKEGNRD